MNLLRFIFNKLPAFTLLVMLILPSENALPQDKKKSTKTKKPEFDISVGLNSFYDDNILKYSKKYLDRFMNNEDSGRFHIETYDDVVLNPSVKLGATYKFFGKLDSKINADFYYNYYTVNNVKNWGYFNLGFQQYLTKKASIKFYYSYIPDFYVRHFRDDDWVKVYGYKAIAFQPYAFSKESYNFYAQNTFFKNTRIRGLVSYALYYHNEHFTEYDCKNWVFAFNLLQPVHKKVKLELGWEFTASDAVGYDEPFETRESSDDADATFVEDVYTLAVTWELPKIRKMKNRAGIDTEYAKRYYTTKNYLEEDPEHAGRVDDAWRCFFTWDLDISKSFEFSAFYKWYGRNTTTLAEENQEYLSAEKNYRQNQVGIGVTYSFNFK